MKIVKTGKLLRKYPVVFNNLQSVSLNSLDEQIDNLNLTFKKKAEEITKANEVVKNYIFDVFKDGYFFKYLSSIATKNPNKIFVKEIRYDGVKFFVDLYEYGVETKIATQTIYNDLSKLYSQVIVEKLEEKNFFSNMKYFHYTVEGVK
jgi:hypothetical protein